MHARHLPTDALVWTGIMLLFTVPLPSGASPDALLDPGFWTLSLLRSALVLVLVRFRGGRTPWGDWGPGRSGFAAASLLVLLIAAATIIDGLVGDLAPPPGRHDPGELAARSSGVLLWILAVPGLALAAFAEERFFREFTLGLSRTAGIPAVLSVLGSAVIFGLGHLGGGIPSALFAVIAGLFLALVYLRSGSVIAGTISHWLYNLLLLIGLVG